MKPRRLLTISALHGIAFAFGLAIAFPAMAQSDMKKKRPDLVLTGDAKCTRCHDETEDYPVLAIGKTKHGTRADKRTPTCTKCHGESETHVNKPPDAIERPAPDRAFGKNSKTPMQERSEVCLTCHQNNATRSHWDGSTHQTRDVACTSCHQIHTGHDKVRDKRTQPTVCFTCHKQQRGQIDRPSHHPIPEGKMTCSDCHNPHGSVGPALMKRDTINDVCYTCHMEKRGPFVHNHEPVNENCALCHDPHGTVTPTMLRMRPPFLCHSCHTPHSSNNIASAIPFQVPGNASVGNTTGKNATNYAMARGCLNCHTQVHGTNNPSVMNPTPQFNLR
jgi:DmsE family decaheme c-type cytochrome